jgi:hypothetical protein
MGIRAIATGLLLLATVTGTLACEMLTPLPSDGPTASSAGNAPMTGAGGANPGLSVGADAGTGGALASSPPSPAVMQELMSRWNLAVDASNATIDFHWPYVNGFPHPTFKGGTAEAYGQFASILLVFLQSNFDFLAQNHLFAIELHDDTLSGPGGVVTSFEQLADSFSASNAFGNITPDVHDGLVQMAQRIHQL